MKLHKKCTELFLRINNSCFKKRKAVTSHIFSFAFRMKGFVWNYSCLILISYFIKEDVTLHFPFFTAAKPHGDSFIYQILLATKQRRT